MSARSLNPGRSLAFAAALLACAAALSAPHARAVAYEPDPAFCAPTVLTDHLKPLEQLPQLRWPPHPSFAPDSVRISTSNQLVVEYRHIAYTLGLDRRVPTIHPNWS